MAKGSQRTWAPWEKEAAKDGCVVCGKRVLNSEASMTRYDARTDTISALHAHCMPRVRLVVER